MPTISQKTNLEKDNLGIRNSIVYDMSSSSLGEFTVHGSWRLDNIISDQYQLNTQDFLQNVPVFRRPLRLFYCPNKSEKFPLKMFRNFYFLPAGYVGTQSVLTDSQNKWMG